MAKVLSIPRLLLGLLFQVRTRFDCHNNPHNSLSLYPDFVLLFFWVFFLLLRTFRMCNMFIGGCGMAILRCLFVCVASPWLYVNQQRVANIILAISLTINIRYERLPVY